jgi:glycosyltransferase involved in cell wall biosynthesis
VDTDELTTRSLADGYEPAAHIRIGRVGEHCAISVREAGSLVAEIDVDDVPPPQLSSRYRKLTISWCNEAFAVDSDVARAFRAVVRFATRAAHIEISEENRSIALPLEWLRHMAIVHGVDVIDSKCNFVYRPLFSKQSTKKLVSILIASWNPRYFEKALRSALAQTYRNLEIVVCDDARDGAIEAIVNKCRALAVPIFYERNAERLMTRKNYERCFARANGEYIKFLNDDDLLEPRCVERLVAALEAEPSAVLATSARCVIDERGGPMHDMPATTPLFASDHFVDGQSLANALLLLGLNFIGEPSTALFRRDVAQVNGEALLEFSGERGRGVTDFVLWTRLLCRGDAVYLRERLSNFRVHPEQRQALAEVRARALDAIPALREKWIELGLHEAMPPNVLRARPIGRTLPLGFQLIASFAQPGAHPEQLVTAWRNKQHPFFLARSNAS